MGIFALVAVAAVIGLTTVGPSKAASRDTIVPTTSYADTCFNDNPSANGPVCMADNANTSAFFQSSVTSTVKSTVKTALGEYDSSDLSISYPATAVYDGSSETDIIYQISSSDVPSGIIGMTWCDDAVDSSSYRCDQHYVRFRSASVVDQELACHESGHAFGLLHGTSTAPPVADNNGDANRCMETPDTGSRPHPGPLNIENINENY